MLAMRSQAAAAGNHGARLSCVINSNQVSKPCQTGSFTEVSRHALDQQLTCHKVPCAMQTRVRSILPASLPAFCRVPHGMYTCWLQAAAQTLVVSAPVSMPSLSIQPAGALFFKPTCIGASSQRQLTLHNTSRVPLAFKVCLLEHEWIVI